MQPLWPVPHNNLANLYLIQGRKKEAIAKLESTIAANPKDPSAYLSLALLYEKDKDARGAIRIYERALKENPGFWFAGNNLAFLLTEFPEGPADLARAKQLAESALRLRPNEPAVLDTLGWVLFRLGDANQARVLIEQALAGAPEADVLNYHLGAVLAKLGQKDLARERLIKALDGDEEFPGRTEAVRLMKELG
jgi:tetratricopeptide (TPR) repeat protein